MGQSESNAWVELSGRVEVVIQFSRNRAPFQGIEGRTMAESLPSTNDHQRVTAEGLGGLDLNVVEAGQTWKAWAQVMVNTVWFGPVLATFGSN